ncbi:hypothetical protein DIPPA_26483 [Diplonema papillatum]|nr:hypothetical protein DIPPA_26483 [Diplonema papillatum]
MPGAHGPPETWLSIGLEVRARRPELKRDEEAGRPSRKRMRANEDSELLSKYGIGTVLGVDKEKQRVGLVWKDGGRAKVSFGDVWLPTPPRPVLLQSASPLFIDSCAMNRTDCAQRLTRQYSLRNTQTRREAAARLEGGVVGPLRVPHDVLYPSGDTYDETPTYISRRRRIFRCPCGWHNIVTPMSIMCKQCHCWVHCVCVGLRRPEDSPSRVLTQCAFCEYGWAKPQQIIPLPPVSAENEPYQVPLELVCQRFYGTSIPAHRDLLHTILKRVRSRLASKGYDIEQILGGKHGALDCEATVQECVDTCSSAVQEGYFDHRYPSNAFNAMRTDSCSRVTVLRDRKTGKSVAVLASGGNDCPLVFKAACIQLRRALQDPYSHQYLDLSDTTSLKELAGIDNYHNYIHLSLVATMTRNRQQGLGSLLMLYDLASWAAEGRVQMYLNMTLLRKTVNVPSKKNIGKNETRAVYYYSEPSRRLYERFGFRLLYPRKPYSQPHSLLPNESSVRCRWTDKEVNNGVLMANCDIWPHIINNYNAMFPETQRVILPPKSHRPFVPVEPFQGGMQQQSYDGGDGAYERSLSLTSENEEPGNNSDEGDDSGTLAIDSEDADWPTCPVLEQVDDVEEALATLEDAV